MIFNEIEFDVKTHNGNDFLKQSFYEIDSSSELANLKVGQKVDIEWNGSIIECVVESSVWNEYNIRGFLLSYKLKVVL